MRSLVRSCCEELLLRSCCGGVVGGKLEELLRNGGELVVGCWDGEEQLLVGVGGDLLSGTAVQSCW